MRRWLARLLRDWARRLDGSVTFTVSEKVGVEWMESHTVVLPHGVMEVRLTTVGGGGGGSGGPITGASGGNGRP